VKIAIEINRILYCYQRFLLSSFWSSLSKKSRLHIREATVYSLYRKVF